MKLKNILVSSLAVIAIVGGSMVVVQAVSGEAATAQSMSAKSIVDQAIAEGIVGETAAGYLALTSGTASPKIMNAMNEVNAGRKTVYTRLAREQNIQVDVVAVLTGEKQLAKAAPGSKIMNKQGKWLTVK